MLMKQKMTIFTLLAAFVVMVGVMFSGATVMAANECDKVNTSIIPCEDGDGEGVQGTPLWGVLILVINILTAGVGIAAVAGVIFGAFLYTTAGGNPEQVKKAIGIITNVVIGVVAYAGMYIFLNFIIPGGLFT